MSKLKKRILSLILCAVLCISFLPVCACGADEGQPIAEENETDIIPEETVLQEDPAIEENDGAAEDEGPPEEENDIAEEPAENTESSTGEAPAAEESAPSFDPETDGQEPEENGEAADADPEAETDDPMESFPEDTEDAPAETTAEPEDTEVAPAETTAEPEDPETPESGDAEPVAAAVSGTGTEAVAASAAKEKKESGEKKGIGDEEPVTIEVILDNITADDGTENEELLNAFTEQLLLEAIPGRQAMKAAKNIGGGFTGVQSAIYGALRSKIEKTAEGTRASTKYTVDLSDFNLSYTASELGFSSFNSSNQSAAVSRAAQKGGIDLHVILSALLADCPYELYWFDKTIGVRPQYTADVTSSKVTINGLSMSFRVAGEYAASNYKLDTTCIDTVNRAINRAKSIADSVSALSDWEKLASFRRQICSLTDYNTAATGYNVTYGNPWQIIWVFDGKDSTKVVCEGYAKAFQYLCDQTSFSSASITCYTVTGKVSSRYSSYAEGHMWNVVTMDDGKNYLVDVTNCDSGSIGSPDKLFLQGYDSGSRSSGYKINMSNSNWVQYSYDMDTFNLYSSRDLTLAQEDYLDNSHIHDGETPVKENVVKATYRAAGSYDEVVYCSICGRELSRTHRTVAKRKLDTPQLKSISSKAAKVTLKWNAVSGAKAYRVLRKEAGSDSWKKIADTTELTYKDKTVTPGARYTYTVRCISKDGSYYMSSFDKTGKTITAAFQLATPELSAVKNTAEGVRIRWTAVSGAEKYRVLRKVSDGKWQKLADVTGTKYTDTTVKIGTSYSYAVRCISKDGKTNMSAYDSSGRTIKAAYVLAAPTLLKAAGSAGKITVRWSAVSGAGKYRVFRKTVDGKWQKLADVTGEKYTDKTAESGTEYIYTVRCVSSDGKRIISDYDRTGLHISCK